MSAQRAPVEGSGGSCVGGPWPAPGTQRRAYSRRRYPGRGQVEKLQATEVHGIHQLRAWLLQIFVHVHLTFRAAEVTVARPALEAGAAALRVLSPCSRV